ncbi:MAG TPA: ABC transporter substrate-binding protein [Alphaproteobacteria bacterium]
MSSRIAAAVAAGFLISIAFVSPAPAADASSQGQARPTVPEASRFISALADEAIHGVTDTSITDPERIQRFRELLRLKFDIPSVSRFVLGRYWRAATPEERTEYTQLFEDYIVQTYATRFREYRGEGLRVGNATQASDQEILVVSNIVRDGPPIRVEWKVRPDGNTFKIVDVIVEGVSMAVTQRDDFAATIQARGGKVAGLIEALKQKVRTASN